MQRYLKHSARRGSARQRREAAACAQPPSLLCPVFPREEENKIGLRNNVEATGMLYQDCGDLSVHLLGDFGQGRFIGHHGERLLHVFGDGLSSGAGIGHEDVQDPVLADASHNLASLDHGNLRDVVLTHEIHGIFNGDTEWHKHQILRAARLFADDLPGFHLNRRLEELRGVLNGAKNDMAALETEQSTARGEVAAERAKLEGEVASATAKRKATAEGVPAGA